MQPTKKKQSKHKRPRHKTKEKNLNHHTEPALSRLPANSLSHFRVKSRPSKIGFRMMSQTLSIYAFSWPLAGLSRNLQDLSTKQVLLTFAGHEIHSAVLHHMPKANLLEWGPEQYIHAVGSTGNLKINKHT